MRGILVGHPISMKSASFQTQPKSATGETRTLPVNIDKSLITWLYATLTDGTEEKMEPFNLTLTLPIRTIIVISVILAEKNPSSTGKCAVPRN